MGTGLPTQESVPHHVPWRLLSGNRSEEWDCSLPMACLLRSKPLSAGGAGRGACVPRIAAFLSLGTPRPTHRCGGSGLQPGVGHLLSGDEAAAPSLGAFPPHKPLLASLRSKGLPAFKQSTPFRGRESTKAPPPPAPARWRSTSFASAARPSWALGEPATMLRLLLPPWPPRSAAACLVFTACA